MGPNLSRGCVRVQTNGVVKIQTHHRTSVSCKIIFQVNVLWYLKRKFVRT